MSPVSGGFDTPQNDWKNMPGSPRVIARLSLPHFSIPAISLERREAEMLLWNGMTAIDLSERKLRIHLMSVMETKHR